MSKYSVAIETITPDQAREMLERFPRNRKSNPHRVDMYVDSMRRGKWAPISTIIVDENGDTVDGHHRLEAVAKSGIPVDMVVFRGLEKTFVPFIDTGRPRSAGDMLAFIDGLNGISAFDKIAALARGVLRFEARDLNLIVQADKIADFVLSNQELLNLAYNDYRNLNAVGGSLAHSVALLIIRMKNAFRIDRFNEFVKQIVKGENIHEGMPTYAVVQTLRGKNLNTSKGAGLYRAHLFVILRAWNAFVNSEPIMRFRVADLTSDQIFNVEI